MMSSYPMIKKKGETYYIGVDYQDPPLMSVCIMTVKDSKCLVQYAETFNTPDYHAEVEKLKEFYKGCHIIREA